MKRKWWILLIILILSILIICAIFSGKGEKQQDGKTKIVTSFYPIYIIAMNITQGAQNIELTNLTQNDVGCLHDYTLSSSDMKKMENANILIENGLGLENFIDKIVTTYPKLKIINSSEKVNNIVNQGENVNPHIWLNIENYKTQVETVTNYLCEYNQENAEIYKKNSQEYIQKLTNLESRYHNELQTLNGKKVVCLDETITYLAKQLQMESIEIVTHHEESTLSADTLKNTIQSIKNDNINVIFIGEDESAKNAETLASETNAKIYQLNTCLKGELSNEAYITSMEKNLEILKQIK